MNQKSDPKLTAFALGELEGEEEIQMSQMVEKDPELKAEVESIKAVAKSLEVELGKTSPVRLDPSEREAIFAKTVDRPAAWWKSKSVLFPAGGLLAALFLGVLIVPQLQQQISTTQVPQGGQIAVREVKPAFKADSVATAPVAEEKVNSDASNAPSNPIVVAESAPPRIRR